MTIKVLESGLAISVQDLGRPGYYQLGIPIGGAMDRFSLRVANLIVGNEEGAAGLEVTFLGPKLEFLERTTIAVTGGDMPILVNGKEHASWQPITVEKGQFLEFGYIKENNKSVIIIFIHLDSID